MVMFGFFRHVKGLFIFLVSDANLVIDVFRLLLFSIINDCSHYIRLNIDSH